MGREQQQVAKQQKKKKDNTRGNLEPPINLMCMFLSCGRKTGENQLRSIKEVQTGAGMEPTERLKRQEWRLFI